jgi:hypothetical protein
MYYYATTLDDLAKLITNPDFKVMDVYGAKPGSKEYKSGKGFWRVQGRYINKGDA